MGNGKMEGMIGPQGKLIFKHIAGKVFMSLTYRVLLQRGTADSGQRGTFRLPSNTEFIHVHNAGNSTDLVWRSPNGCARQFINDKRTATLFCFDQTLSSEGGNRLSHDGSANAKLFHQIRLGWQTRARR